MMELHLVESYAMDDSCQLQYWARGHWSWGEFVTAVQDRIRTDERDIPSWVVLQAPVKTLYQRAVPCRDSIVGDTRLVHSDKPGRGATAVTLMDFWFPLHAYRPTKPLAPAAPCATEALARYCPGCGSVGPVDAKYRDCCPDGAEARMIPASLAEKCRDTFKIAVGALLADAAANDASSTQDSVALTAAVAPPVRGQTHG